MEGGQRRNVEIVYSWQGRRKGGRWQKGKAGFLRSSTGSLTWEREKGTARTRDSRGRMYRYPSSGLVRAGEVDSERGKGVGIGKGKEEEGGREIKEPVPSYTVYTWQGKRSGEQS